MDIDANASIETEPHPTWLERLRAIPLGVWGFIVLLLALLTLRLVRAWFLSHVPDIGDPFDVAAFCKSMEVPPGQDAITAYRRAAKTCFSEQKSQTKVPSEAVWDAVSQDGWHRADETVKDWVKTHEASLLEVKQATERDHVWFNPSEDLLWPYDEGEYVSSFHRWNGLMTLRGRKCEAEKDFAGAFQWYRTILRVHEQLWGAPWSRSVIDDLPNILRWAALPELTVAQLRTALAQLRHDRALIRPASHAIKVEYIRAMNTLKQRDGLATAIRYNGSPTPMDLQTTVYCRFVYWVCGEPERTRRLYQHLVANQLRGVDLPGPTRRPLYTPTSTLIYGDDAAVPLPSKHLSAKQIAEAIRTSGISFGLECSVNGIQLLREPRFERVFRDRREFPPLFELALVLQIHRREYGTFPTRLEDLVPSYVEAVPVDPCDPKALPVRYRLDSADQATLWSVGGDDTDDNGVRGADAVLVVHASVVVGDASEPRSGKE